MEPWYFNAIRDEYSIELASRIYAGQENEYTGELALKIWLVDDVREAIHEAIDDGTPAAEAFNEVAYEWPQGGQGLLAAREAIDPPEGVDDSYVDEVRFLGLATDWLSEDGEGLELSFDEIADLDLYYGENPFEDDRLNEQEAEAVARLRALGIDESEVDFDLITDVDDFIYWVSDTDGDVELALNVHPFGRSADPRVVQHAYSPDEWEQLDYEDIRTGDCVICHSQLYEIESPLADDGQIAWVLANGDTSGAELANYGDEFYAPDFAGDQALICDSCAAEFESEDTSTILAIDASGRACYVSIHAGTLRESGRGVHYTDLRERTTNAIEGLATHHNPDGWYRVEPDGLHGVEPTVYDLPEVALESGDICGPILIHRHPNSQIKIHFPRDVPGAVAEAKQLAENAPELVA